MNPKIYQMLNDVDSNSSDYENVSFSQTEAKSTYRTIKSRMYKRKKYSGIAVAACCTLCLGAALLAGPFQSEVKAAVQNVTSYIGNFLGLKEDIKPYEQIVGKSVTANGVTMTLNAVVLDRESLVVSLLETHKEAATDLIPVSLPGILKVNGKEVPANGGGTGQQVDDNAIEHVFELDLKGIDTSKQLDIELQFVSIEETGGDWKFAFQADGKALSKDTVNIPVDYSFTLADESEMTLKELTKNAMGAKIHYTAKNTSPNTAIVLEGTDDLGNEVSFYLASGTNDGGIFKLDNFIGNLDKDAASLTLTPYEMSPSVSGKGQQRSETSNSVAIEQDEGTSDSHTEVVEGDSNGSLQTMAKKPVGEAFTIVLK